MVADPDILKKRIELRLEALGKKPRPVSIAAGMGGDGIRNIQRGKSISPRSKNLAALARELKCSIAYLLGETEQPDGRRPHKKLLGKTLSTPFEEGLNDQLTKNRNLHDVSVKEWLNMTNEEREIILQFRALESRERVAVRDFLDAQSESQDQRQRKQDVTPKTPERVK